jgi:hypothetical protein
MRLQMPLATKTHSEDGIRSGRRLSFDDGSADPGERTHESTRFGCTGPGNGIWDVYDRTIGLEALLGNRMNFIGGSI